MIDAYAPIISLIIDDEALWSKSWDCFFRGEPFGLTDTCFYTIERGIEILLKDSILNNTG
jgi:hypothetical protein